MDSVTPCVRAVTQRTRCSREGKRHVARNHSAHHSHHRTARGVQWVRRRPLLWDRILWRRCHRDDFDCRTDPGFAWQALTRQL